MMNIRKNELLALIGVALIVVGAVSIHVGFGILVIGMVMLISRAYLDAEGGDSWEQPTTTPTDPLPEQYQPPKGPTA